MSLETGEPTKSERAFYDRRIRIASAFKRATCGKGEITSELFGETDETNQYYKPISRMSRAEQAVKRQQMYQAKKNEQFRQRLDRTRHRQREHGGTYGISFVPHTQKTKPRWRAHIGQNARAFDCAIAAAECRNAAMRRLYPDHPIFCVDMDAIWEKFGCVCGKHSRSLVNAS